MPDSERSLHFRDSRPPQEIQFYLERRLMALFEVAAREPKLEWRTTLRMGTEVYRCRLVFEAAFFVTNCYFFHVETDGGRMSWFDFWAQGWKPAQPPNPADNSVARYQKLATQAATAEAHLTDVAAVQREILAALRRGASFSTAHKEGGTNIRYHRGRYVAADYGESSGERTFDSDEAFLAYLRKFFHYQVNQNYRPDAIPELVAWKLILRLLHRGADSAPPFKSLLARLFG